MWMSERENQSDCSYFPVSVLTFSISNFQTENLTHYIVSKPSANSSVVFEFSSRRYDTLQLQYNTAHPLCPSPPPFSLFPPFLVSFFPRFCSSRHILLFFSFFFSPTLKASSAINPHHLHHGGSNGELMIVFCSPSLTVSFSFV